ncbi:MAG: hypothetical protein QOI38_2460 [Sphingomonadales bacterium]|nr:hypothetical protein [Sphingomonadales bacterium]
MVWLILLGYMALVSLLVVALDRLRPHSRRRDLVVVASLPAPLALGIFCAVQVATIGPAQPGELDAGAMAMMAFMFIGTVGSGTLLIVGLAVSLLVSFYLRPRLPRPGKEDQAVPDPPGVNT